MNLNNTEVYLSHHICGMVPRTFPRGQSSPEKEKQAPGDVVPGAEYIWHLCSCRASTK